MRRREFFKHSGKAAVAMCTLPTGTGAYGIASGTDLHIDRPILTLAKLPISFESMTIAFMSDLHHGPFVSHGYVAGLVRTVLSLAPDLILLGGDYSLRERRFITPCIELLGELSAPLGVYAVMGNHDYAHGVVATRNALKRAGIVELTNTGEWFTRGPDRLRIGGVDDLWHGTPDIQPALGNATLADACLVVSHNPDFAETVDDPRVGLILSGHTHGGQVNIPGYGAPLTPSAFGQKYAHGLAKAPCTNVYTSSGTGMSILPIRLNCRPEINLITLTSGTGYPNV